MFSKTSPDAHISRPTRRWSKWLGAALGVSLVAGSALGSALSGKGPLQDDTKQAAAKPRVRVVRVGQSAATHRQRYSGSVRDAQRASLAFTLGGRLVSRPARVGDHVKRGQVLARIDGLGPQNRVSATAAKLLELDTRVRQAERDTKRANSLYESGAISAAEQEATTLSRVALGASRASLQAELKESRRTLRETVLRAPFDGEVVSVALEPGEFAAPGVPILTLTGAAELEVEVQVPESLAQHLAAGSQVHVELPLANRKHLSGHVRSVGTASAGAGRLFAVVVALPQEAGVLPGMTAELALRVDSPVRPAIPVSAVLDPVGERPYVFRVVGDRVERVDVQVGDLVGDRVLVSGKLRSGDRVVAAGHAFLLSGDHVEAL